jgi:hypothetical protein
MVVAVIASFGYSALVLVGMIGIRVQLLAGAAYFVLITLWFVLPMGALLGAYLPQSMAALNRQMAMTKGFRWGAAFGIVCGVLWATQLSLGDFALEMLLWWILLFGGTAGIYSACFVALVGRKYANKELPPNLADSLAALPTICLPPSLQPWAISGSIAECGSATRCSTNLVSQRQLIRQGHSSDVAVGWRRVFFVVRVDYFHQTLQILGVNLFERTPISQALQPLDMDANLLGDPNQLILFDLWPDSSVISRGEILSEVFGYEGHPHTRTVDTHILRLRQKLESGP